jgi:hypothetical protein
VQAPQRIEAEVCGMLNTKPCSFSIVEGTWKNQEVEKENNGKDCTLKVESEKEHNG